MNVMLFSYSGSFTIDKVVPQATGDSSKVKVKVRVNINGVFTVSTASMIEKVENKEEPMEVEETSTSSPQATDQEMTDDTASTTDKKTEGNEDQVDNCK